jgi:hypothetical protein
MDNYLDNGIFNTHNTQMVAQWLLITIKKITLIFNHYESLCIFISSPAILLFDALFVI